jgi:hypothetical protein
MCSCHQICCLIPNVEKYSTKRVAISSIVGNRLLAGRWRGSKEESWQERSTARAPSCDFYPSQYCPQRLEAVNVPPNKVNVLGTNMLRGEPSGSHAVPFAAVYIV